MKNKVTKSVFELLRIEYNVGFYTYTTYVPQYPLFNVNTERIGLYSSLAEAERGINNYFIEIEEDNEEELPPYMLREPAIEKFKRLFGFLIKEFSLDKSTYYDAKSIRNYLPDGSLLDTVNGDDKFRGRPLDKERFRAGDLVEVLDGTVRLGDTVRLDIVLETPISPEKKASEINSNGFMASMDRYHTMHFSDKYEDHFPSPDDLFPLRFPVSDELRSNLEARYRARCLGEETNNVGKS